jgi:hypothetical protein
MPVRTKRGITKTTRRERRKGLFVAQVPSHLERAALTGKKTAIEGTGTPLTSRHVSLEQDRAAQNEAALKISEAEVDSSYELAGTPYSDRPLRPDEMCQVGRAALARSPGSEVRVPFGDLSEPTRTGLWEKDKSNLAFPAGVADAIRGQAAASKRELATPTTHRSKQNITAPYRGDCDSRSLSEIRLTPQKPVVQADVLLTSSEAAEFLRCSVSWLAKARMTGDGPPYVRIGRSVRYRLVELISWLKSQRRLSVHE